MTMAEKEIVKYDDKYWVLEKISESDMATIWRDGQPAIVPVIQLERNIGEKEK